MQRKIVIKITGCLSAFMLLISSVQPLQFMAESNDFVHGTGLKFSSEEDSMYFDDTEEGTTVPALYSNGTLPKAIDLSEEIYFPPIGEQGNINSCTAWATTYYQFTYAAKKLHEIVII